jgi:hypothetical protein
MYSSDPAKDRMKGELTEREIPYAKNSPERENAVALNAAVPSVERRLG